MLPDPTYATLDALRKRTKEPLSDRELVIISDFGIQENSLDHDIGEFKLGGAEQHDSALVHYMSELLDKKVTSYRCPEVHPGLIQPENRYIISNYTSLSPAVKEALQSYGNYVIYEHDHQYCSGRNPFVFPDMLVPLQAQLNVAFYAKAQAVVCMTRKHQELLDSNIATRCTCNIGGTFYFQNELDFMEALHKARLDKSIAKKRTADKKSVAAVYGHPHPLKGMHNSVRYCQAADIPFEVIEAKPTKKEFLEELAKFDRLVFLPLQPETCCRVVVEAMMIGITVHTSSIVGATGEPWYHSYDIGTKLIKEMGEPLRYRALSCVLDNLARVEDVTHSNT